MCPACVMVQVIKLKSIARKSKLLLPVTIRYMNTNPIFLQSRRREGLFSGDIPEWSVQESFWLAKAYT